MDRFEIARALREIAALLRLKQEPQFRSRAYENGARGLEQLQGDLDRLVEQHQLTTIPGIGKGLARVIAELHSTGRSEVLDRLRAEYPPGITELVHVRGLGLSKIAELHQSLGISSIAELKAACESGALRRVRGFSAKSEAQLLVAIAALEGRGDRVLLVNAEPVAAQLLAYLRSGPAVKHAEVAGSLRRRQETVGNLDIVVATGARSKIGAILDYVEALPQRIATAERGENYCSIRLADGLRADVRVTITPHLISALHHFTGSPGHFSKLRQRGRRRGLGFDEERWCWQDGDGEVRWRDEAELYQRLGLQPIPPELREDQGEIEAAAKGLLPELIREGEVRGLVHCHTVYSDGKNSIAEMAETAAAMGMEYITITDHSPRASYAGGLTVDRLRRQWDEIAEVQERVPVQLLRGTESDI
ncbi:MAG TPA: PHP domain-containing protein, partial [Terriglobales bacterium]|nr:PHP domain-containing protein [Terriglobales bacterium]